MFYSIARVARVVKIVEVVDIVSEQMLGTKMIQFVVFLAPCKEFLKETVSTGLFEVFSHEGPKGLIITPDCGRRMAPHEV